GRLIETAHWRLWRRGTQLISPERIEHGRDPVVRADDFYSEPRIVERSLSMHLRYRYICVPVGDGAVARVRFPVYTFHAVCWRNDHWRVLPVDVHARVVSARSPGEQDLLGSGIESR